MKKLQLAFLHIPKTGGRTIIDLCRHFNAPHQCGVITDYKNPPNNDRMRFVHGHFPYDSLPPVKGRLLFTILREPGARIASYYQMSLKSRPNEWPQYDRFWAYHKPMDIIDFANNGIQMTSQIDNAMVRQSHSYELLISERAVNEADVEVAKHNLSAFGIVGFTDDYDSFVDRLCNMMGWEKPQYPKRNQSYPYVVDEGVLARIRHINRFDVMLYNWAKENLNGQCHI